jgi:aspartyl-tRNA(Asn)/glutamyl-tRNA(Gln) amidotransferase subunit C
MPVSLTRDDVLRIAELARLELTEDEVELFTRQLASILDYVEQIRELNTTGVPATSQVIGQAIDREDVVGPQLSRDEALANAPDAAIEAGLFKVPRVMA